MRHFYKSDILERRSVLPLIKETPFTSKSPPISESTLKRALAAVSSGYNIGTGGGAKCEECKWGELHLKGESSLSGSASTTFMPDCRYKLS